MIYRKPASLVLACLLAGCSQAPLYVKPAMNLPASFKEAPGWKPAGPADASKKGRWWELFGDPVLNALEERVSVSNQNVAAYSAAYAQARAAVRQAQAARYPTVNLSAGATASGSFGQGQTAIVGGTTSGGSSPGSNGVESGTALSADALSSDRRYTVNIGASWEPDLWGRIGSQVTQQRAAAAASQGDLHNATLAARGELASDYLQLRGLEAQRTALDDTVKAYARALTITQNRYRAGISARVDVLQAETQFRNAQAQATDIARQRATLEHAIAVLVGENPSSFTLPPAPRTQAVPDVPAILPSELLERRPDIAAAERRVAAANAAIGVQRTAFFPSLSLSGSAGFNSGALDTLFNASNSLWSLGAQGLLTLFDFGARKAQVAQARAAYDQTVAQYRQTVLTAFQQTEDQLAAVRVLADVAAQRSAAAAAADRVEQITLNQYLAGQISYTDVITAQATALTARQNIISADVDRQTAAVALIQAIGGQWFNEASDIAAPP